MRSRLKLVIIKDDGGFTIFSLSEGCSASEGTSLSPAIFIWPKRF
jgi:hypothetical protein